MSKYTNELKLEIVKYVVESKHTFNEASKKFGITKNQIQKWVRLYNYHGTQGLITKNGKYSGDFKVCVVRYMHETRNSLFNTAAYFGIPDKATVSKWERIYNEKGPQALFEDGRERKKSMSADKPKKLNKPKHSEESLAEEVQGLRMENAYLKKLNALIQEREKSVKKTKESSSMN